MDIAEKKIDNLHVYASLGAKRYLSLMKFSELVLGNSSSGIIETPAFHVPTVNIGDRQRGRLQSENIVNCGTKTENIVAAIKQAMSQEHRKICRDAINPYGDGHAAERIADRILRAVSNEKIDLKKKFFDLKVKNE